MALHADLTVDSIPEAVTVTLTVTNRGDTPQTLTFPTGQIGDITVVAGEEVVWRWSEGRLFTQAIQEQSLDPGESLSMTATWSEPGSGSYRVRATVEAANTDLTAETTFER